MQDLLVYYTTVFLEFGKMKEKKQYFFPLIFWSWFWFFFWGGGGMLFYTGVHVNDTSDSDS